MTDTRIHCPECGTEIPISEVSGSQLRTEMEKRLKDEQDLRLKEKEKQIEDLRKALDAAKRKSQQGSQENQGEVLELDIQARLEQLFPQDQVRPVPKGVPGADLIQEVRNPGLQTCDCRPIRILTPESTSVDDPGHPGNSTTLE